MLRAVPAIFVVGVVTFICFTFRVGFETVSLCYLIVVVLQSLSGNFLSSAIVSVVSFLCLDYFFVPPFFSLRVSDASDTLALISFLTAGLVITRLTSRARKAADLEKLQREETTRLYKLAHELLVSKPDTAVGPDLLQQFKSEFNLRAVCFFDAGTTQLFFEGVSQDHLDEKTRAAYILQRDSEDETLGIAVRVLPGANGPAGAIGFEGLRDIELTAAPLAALAAVMMERAHVFRRASQAAAAAETEVFRGAVLDALAHEFKTPLATILTAAGGLREVGPLLPAQAELAQTVESENVSSVPVDHAVASISAARSGGSETANGTDRPYRCGQFVGCAILTQVAEPAIQVDRQRQGECERRSGTAWPWPRSVAGQCL